MRPIRRIDDLRMLGHGRPNLNLAVDREAAARYQMNVADVGSIQTAVGVMPSARCSGEQRYDLVARYLPRYRGPGKPSRTRLLSPAGERVSLAQLCKSAWPTVLHALSRGEFALRWYHIRCSRRDWAPWRKPSARSPIR